MTNRQQIEEQLIRWQRELATINADRDNPEQACDDYGLSGDFCTVFKQHLSGESAQVEVIIATLQEELRIYDLFVGTWAINIQGHSENFVGQLKITSPNTGTTFLGTMVAADTPRATAISGSYNDSEQQINFTRYLPDGFAQQYAGTVSISAQPPTMQGEMIWLLPTDTGDDLLPSSRWSAQKQS